MNGSWRNSIKKNNHSLHKKFYSKRMNKEEMVELFLHLNICRVLSCSSHRVLQLLCKAYSFTLHCIQNCWRTNFIQMPTSLIRTLPLQDQCILHFRAFFCELQRLTTIYWRALVCCREEGWTKRRDQAGCRLFRGDENTFVMMMNMIMMENVIDKDRVVKQCIWRLQR